MSAMVQSLAETDQYAADFARFEREVGGEDAPWLRELRRQAIERFARVGFPTARRGNEEWKYTNVAPLARTAFRYSFQAPTISASEIAGLHLVKEWPRLIFVDGRYSPELSATKGLPPFARVGSLAEHLVDGEAALEAHLGRLAHLNGDGFTALSTAFLRDGAFIHLPAGCVLERPIHLLFVSTGAHPETVAYPRVLAVLGAGASGVVVENYVALGEQRCFTDAVTEVALEEGAGLRHYRLLEEGGRAPRAPRAGSSFLETGSVGDYHIATTQVRQERDSSYSRVAIMAGGLLARDTLSVLLDGEGAECRLEGLYVTTGGQHVDNHTFIDHAQPRTTSRELYKGILGGQSRAVFSGRILVRNQAQKADARLVNKNLVLSEGAEVDTKPHLEIFADDVKCSHGATAGKLDESSLFYLQSRGLDQQQAQELLARAFASEVIDRIDLAPVKAHVERLMSRGLPGLQNEEQP